MGEYYRRGYYELRKMAHMSTVNLLASQEGFKV